MIKERLHLVLMLALTFSTGIVDAVGYLGFDRVFTGNMTGNVVILGMALSGADGLPILRPALAFCGFLLGALLAGRFLPHRKGVWGPRTSVAFALVGLGLAGISLDIAAQGLDSDAHATTITTLTAVFMGLQAAAARRLGVADVTTVVVTSTIVAFASESKLAGGPGKHWARQFLVIALILLGAVVGGLTLLLNLWTGLGLAAICCLACTVVGERVRRRGAGEVPALA